VEDKVDGNSLRHRDQLKFDAVWAVLRNVILSNARFGLSDRLEVHLDHVKITDGKGGVRTKGRSIDMLSSIKKCIVTVKEAPSCFDYAHTIAMTRVYDDPKYQYIGMVMA